MTCKMKSNVKLLNIQYCLLQALYWGTICMVGGAFSSLFMLSRGYTNTQVGITIAVGNILSVLLQPGLAALVDEGKKITLHNLCILLALLGTGGFILQLFTGERLLAVAAVFMLSYGSMQTLQPMLNSVSLYYINRGVNVNFGAARGIGSAFFAVCSTVLGRMVEHSSADVLLVVGIAMAGLFVIVVKTLPLYPAEEMAKETHREKESMLVFIRKYRGFATVLLGAVLLFTFHNMCNTYLFHIVSRVGGTSETLGVALSIAAIVELPVMAGFSLLEKRFKSRSLLVFAGIMFAVKAVAYLLARNVIQLYICQALQIAGYGLYIPAAVFYVHELVEEQDTVKGQALILSAGTLGGVFASLFGGWMIDTFGVYRMLIVQVVLAVAGAVLLYLAPAPNRARAENHERRK